MRISLLLSCVALFAAATLVAQTSPVPRKKSTTKRATTNLARKQPASGKTAPRKPGSSTALNQKRKTPLKKTPVPPRRSAQLQPTADRYKEIQQALASRGYFNGQSDGNWGPDSIDALKRFQRDQNLSDDGKISSLSLIALGLGPKRAAVQEPPPDKSQIDKSQQ